jgi:hypothetical protein
LSPSPSASPEASTHNDLYTRVSDAADDGRFVIAWANYDNNSVPVVMAQCFGSDGNPTTAQFVVPSYGDQTSSFPDVAMGHDGTFVVIWTGPDIDYTADAVVRSGIQARMYSADGTPLGDQFRVNDISYSWFYNPAISMNKVDKSFIIVWERQWLENKPGFPGNWYQDIECQRYDSAGNKVAVNFEVNTPTSNASGSDWYCTLPSVGIAETGDFVIVWSYQTNNVNAATWCRRYKSTGVPYAAEFKANTANELIGSGSASVDVAVAASGAFTVIWSAYSNTIGGYSTWMRRYNSSGTALAVPAIVNTAQRDYGQNVNRIACDRDGNFTVIWDNPYIPDDPIANISKYGILARSFTAAGVATTDEYIVNNPGLAHRGIDDQYWPDVARNNSTGKWVAAWCGYQGVAPSGGIMGVWHSQIVGTPLPAVAFVITAPLSGSYVAGAHVPVTWTASGIQANSKVNLGITTSPSVYTPATWISVGVIVAENGSFSLDWDTTGIAAGTYYVIGYIFNEDTSVSTYYHAASSFKIT